MANLIDTTAETVEEKVVVDEPVSGLITVKQLPIIEERLESMRQIIADTVSEVLSLPCTEDTVKEIKKKRAELNKQFRLLDNQRKEVKKKVIEPYDRFEKIFKACITEIYTDADEKLSARIDEVERARKAEKESNVRAYFNEYSQSLHIPDYITFERLGIDIILSVSEKKYKEKVKDFLDRVVSDIRLIETQPNSDEIYVEYEKTLDASRSILEVTNRHKRIDEERQRHEALQKSREEEAKSVANVEAALQEELATQAPVEVPTATPIEEPNPNQQLYEGTFKLTGTKPAIIDVLNYIKERNVKIEHTSKFTKVE